MKRILLPLFLLVTTIGANSQESPQTSPSQPSGTLPAPVQLSPTNGARLHGYPRRIVFTWSKVQGADGYGIEIDHYGGHWSSPAGKPTLMDWVKDPTLTVDFYGDQPGSWRVWAMDKRKRPGQVSAWSLFTFGPENEVMPPPPPDAPPRFSQMPGAAHVPVPLGKVHEPPLADPETGETCNWPPPPGSTTGVSPPRAIYYPEPQFTEAARKAKANGDVTLALDVGVDGLVKRVCIVSASRDDLGLSAVKTVRTWRFEPARKDGQPIPYSTTSEVTFRLY